MLDRILAAYNRANPSADTASAHCDGPCGVYDPASARIAAEAVLSMSKKLAGLTPPEGKDVEAWNHYLNHHSRYVAIKEEQAHLAKEELLVLWTDYFKPQHLEQYPDLHDVFWQATKLCSSCKQNVSVESATQLMAAVEKVHNIFWATKGREVPWITAS